jgi:hypothetical protein
LAGESQLLDKNPCFSILNPPQADKVDSAYPKFKKMKNKFLGRLLSARWGGTKAERISELAIRN